ALERQGAQLRPHFAIELVRRHARRQRGKVRLAPAAFLPPGRPGRRPARAAAGIRLARPAVAVGELPAPAVTAGSAPAEGPSAAAADPPAPAEATVPARAAASGPVPPRPAVPVTAAATATPVVSVHLVPFAAHWPVPAMRHGPRPRGPCAADRGAAGSGRAP